MGQARQSSQRGPFAVPQASKRCTTRRRATLQRWSKTQQGLNLRSSKKALCRMRQRRKTLAPGAERARVFQCSPQKGEGGTSAKRQKGVSGWIGWLAAPT